MKQSIPFSEAVISDSQNDMKSMAIKVSDIVILHVYNPTTNQIDNIVLHFVTKFRKVIICGDFNAHHKKELMNIDAWLIANKLSVNLRKTNNILIQTVGSHSPENLTVRLGNVSIQKVSSIKFLGLHLQENLSWKLHMEHVQTKV